METNSTNTTGSLISDFLEYNANSNLSNIFSTTSTASNATRVDLTKNIIIPSGMFFIGVFGNVTALVILSVRPSKVSRSTAFYTLVKALAVIDLIGIVALSPVTIAVYIKGGVLNTGGMALCHYFSGGLLMAGTSTLCVVLVMAGERLLVTKFPFHYGVLVTHTRVNIVITVIVIVSVIGALLPVVGFSHNVDPWPGTWCFFDYRSTDVGSYIYSITYALFGFLVLIITIIFNAAVIQHLWHMRKSRLNSNSIRSTIRTASSAEGGQIDSEKRMVVFLMAITIVFTLCYTPLMVRVMMNQIWNAGRDIESGGLDDKLDLWVIRLASLNQLLDPWVYIISRFTCCRGARERSHFQTIYSSPSVRSKNGIDNQIKPVVADNATPSKLGKSLKSVRKLFTKKNDQKQSDGAMKPPQTAGRLMSQCSTTTASSPLTRTPERSDFVHSSKEPEEAEALCLNTYQLPV